MFSNSNRKYHIRIELQIHAVTCPGVWLCPNGSVDLTIRTLGYIFTAGSVTPRFPILFHETFKMDGVFKNVTCLTALQRTLTNEMIDIGLWQNGRRLAYLKCKLGLIINQRMFNIGINIGDESQLLLITSKCFPGIIGPKLEYTIKMTIKEQFINGNGTTHHSSITMPFCTKANCYQQQPHHNNRRQKPVCHLNQSKKQRRQRNRYPHDFQTTTTTQTNRKVVSSTPPLHHHHHQQHHHDHDGYNNNNKCVCELLSTGIQQQRPSPPPPPPSITISPALYPTYQQQCGRTSDDDFDAISCHVDNNWDCADKLYNSAEFDSSHSNDCVICQAYRRCFNIETKI